MEKFSIQSNHSVSLSFYIPPWTLFLSLHANAAPCGGVFSRDVGEMMSPNWPTGNYPALSVCTWRISIPSNTSIYVGFSHFELQNKNLLGNCVDYVDVINGENMETLGRLLLHPSVHALLWAYFVVCISSSSTHLNRVCFLFFTLQVGSVAPPFLPLSLFPATQL